MGDIKDEDQDSRQAVYHLLEKYKLLENYVQKQEMPRHHDLVESLVRKQGLEKLRKLLNQMTPAGIAEMLESLSLDDMLFIWKQLDERHKEPVLREVSTEVIQHLGQRAFRTDKTRIKAFELQEGRMREVVITAPDDLLNPKLVWIDMLEPTFEERTWVGSVFGIDLPDPERANDIEASARFYVEENGAIYLHSDLLLDKEDVSQSIQVSFILYRDILFTLRMVELPVFRLQRLRALSQPNYVFDAKDVLLDLYAADAEYSADALEDVYAGLRLVSKQVLEKNRIGDQADYALTAIAKEEELNGLIRRNVLDTRRAVSFLMRLRFLNKQQIDDAQQILRDLDSLDAHTAFIFDKINFLMDATVGFINNNQNKNVKRLTVLSVVFMPLNVLAGIGGMSEYSMMTQAIPWPVSYSLFILAMFVIAWITYLLLGFFERREQALAENEFELGQANEQTKANG